MMSSFDASSGHVTATIALPSAGGHSGAAADGVIDGDAEVSAGPASPLTGVDALGKRVAEALPDVVAGESEGFSDDGELEGSAEGSAETTGGVHGTLLGLGAGSATLTKAASMPVSVSRMVPLPSGGSILPSLRRLAAAEDTEDSLMPVAVAQSRLWHPG